MSDDRTSLHRLDQIAKVLDMTRQELIASLEHLTVPGKATTCDSGTRPHVDELIAHAETIADPRLKELLLKVARALDSE